MGGKNTRGNATLAIRPSAATFFKKEEKAIVPKTTSAMRPSVAGFFDKKNPANAPIINTTRPDRKPREFVDLTALTQHPAITIVCNKEISIYIEMCVSMDEKPTDIPALFDALVEYDSIKKLAIKIHAPWPHTEPNGWHNKRIICMKKLFAIIDKFDLYKLKVTMAMDGCNFPQMKLAAAIHGLKFKKWQLYYQVYDEATKSEEGPIKIFRGSEYDSRLRGVWKKEFLAQA
ncbi:hypothetical protein BHYA_0076g00240 [Botrytis hyacinthi]|uniref:Uncharacterized protein n=1 Tax=Botrytis hyacinthi TaxID=278943 RepID=A0A4Z1GYI8_9HELO|nr:hypothetical protein BHYA_0076g00240 [Botrytis hyacinthi]